MLRLLEMKLSSIKIETSDEGELTIELITPDELGHPSTAPGFRVEIDPSLALDISRELGKQALRLLATQSLGKANHPIDARAVDVFASKEKTADE